VTTWSRIPAHSDEPEPVESRIDETAEAAQGPSATEATGRPTAPRSAITGRASPVLIISSVSCDLRNHQSGSRCRLRTHRERGVYPCSVSAACSRSWTILLAGMLTTTISSSFGPLYRTGEDGPLPEGHVRVAQRTDGSDAQGSVDECSKLKESSSDPEGPDGDDTTPYKSMAWTMFLFT